MTGGTITPDNPVGPGILSFLTLIISSVIFWIGIVLLFAGIFIWFKKMHQKKVLLVGFGLLMLSIILTATTALLNFQPVAFIYLPLGVPLFLISSLGF